MSDLLDDLEYFLEIAQESIEDRDQIIRELVRTLEVFEAVLRARPGCDSRFNEEIYDCRAIIAKARSLVPCL
jgi:hypothetical protein